MTKEFRILKEDLTRNDYKKSDIDFIINILNTNKFEYISYQDLCENYIFICDVITTITNDLNNTRLVTYLLLLRFERNLKNEMTKI